MVSALFDPEPNASADVVLDTGATGVAIIGGAFTAVSPAGTPVPVEHLAAFSLAATSGTAFAASPLAPAPVAGTLYPAPGLVTAVALQPDGSVVAGGSFGTPSGIAGSNTVDLARFLQAQAEPLQIRAQEAEVALVCEGPPCEVSLDRHRFNRVIENLLSNALDALAGRDGGRVSLQWSPSADGGVEIQVVDNGKGIPRKVRRRIFEPFFSYGKAKGTGLGMATVKRIMDEHQGTVEVASEEGQGTTITLRLPGPAAQATGGPARNGAPDA